MTKLMEIMQRQWVESFRDAVNEVLDGKKEPYELLQRFHRRTFQFNNEAWGFVLISIVRDTDGKIQFGFYIRVSESTVTFSADEVLERVVGLD